MARATKQRKNKNKKKRKLIFVLFVCEHFCLLLLHNKPHCFDYFLTEVFVFQGVSGEISGQGGPRHPQVFFSLEYDSKFNILTVFVDQARFLRPFSFASRSHSIDEVYGASFANGLVFMPSPPRYLLVLLKI